MSYALMRLAPTRTLLMAVPVSSQAWRMSAKDAVVAAKNFAHCKGFDETKEAMAPFVGGHDLKIPVLLFIFALLFVLALKYDVFVVLPLLLFAGGIFLLTSVKRKQMHMLVSLGMFMLAIAFSFLDRLDIVIGLSVVYMLYAAIENFITKQIRQVVLLSVGVTILFGFAYTSSYLFTNVLERHQQDRINVWLNPEDCDPRGSLYNIKPVQK